MRKRNDLIGKRFNDLVCLSFVGVDKGGNARFLFKCDCGNEKVITGSKVKNEVTKTCGCGVRKANLGRASSSRLKEGEARLNHYYAQYRHSAKKRKISFRLSKRQFIEITKKECHYCGQKPLPLKLSNQNFYGTCKANGVDRINSKYGYYKENVVPCCKMCNILKRDYPQKVFIEKIRSIYEHLELHKWDF
jgi:hypothetical protein